MIVYKFSITKADAGTRLDQFLFGKEEISVTRSQIKRRISEHEILVNGEPKKAGYKTKIGDSIEWCFQEVRPLNAMPQDIPITILFENDDLAFVEKPAGMVVHPSIGHPDQTLVNALLFHFNSLSKDAIRPGIVHRIDKETSGVLVVAKSDDAHQKLNTIFRTHDLVREYHAICFAPSLPETGVFETEHARDPKNRFRFTGRPQRTHDTDEESDKSARMAITHFEILEKFPNKYALVKCTLETGRTHQIRMHLMEADSPIISDKLYGFKNTVKTRFIDRVALHARTLALDWNGEQIRIQSEYPEDFASALEKLRGI